ncbi:hypothetical protein [Stratiformator vulcanicus]|uniref:Peptidase family M23 n=1 Tax=Stratiformator vulcanicus TaxID=2527980 RepID=A0A517QVT6_9PLAN|nr:hypothetical protein [Stratiformator vulcanicus]QDT35694.1 hypothetical protein Pan189_00470 [Stratiformator vulcanicus]
MKFRNCVKALLITISILPSLARTAAGDNPSYHDGECKLSSEADILKLINQIEMPYRTWQEEECFRALGRKIERPCRYSMLDAEQLKRGIKSDVLTHQVNCQWQLAFRQVIEKLVSKLSDIEVTELKDGKDIRDDLAAENAEQVLSEFSRKFGKFLDIELPKWFSESLKRGNVGFSALERCDGQPFRVKNVKSPLYWAIGFPPLQPSDSRENQMQGNGEANLIGGVALSRGVEGVLVKIETEDGFIASFETALNVGRQAIVTRVDDLLLIAFIDEVGAPSATVAYDMKKLTKVWEASQWAAGTVGVGTTGILPHPKAEWRVADGKAFLFGRAMYALFVEGYDIKTGNVIFRFTPSIDLPLVPQ